MALVQLLKERQKGTDFRRALREMVRMELSKYGDEIRNEMKRALKEVVGQEGVNTLKGDRGHTPLRGVDYLTPEEVKQIKKELRPRDGKTPSRGELLSLIQPLIPNVRDGKDADEEMVVSKVIEQLGERFEELNKEVDRKIREVQRIKREKSGGGGGGMGNPQHETFAISSSTSSVQTAWPIAAGGNAIFMASYQGQNLEMTNHYTVSSSDRRTITFHADVQSQFVDDTVFAITYIRS